SVMQFHRSFPGHLPRRSCEHSIPLPCTPPGRLRPAREGPRPDRGPRALGGSRKSDAMSADGQDRQVMEKIAEVIGRRLSPADLKSVLKEIDQARRGEKGVERIIAEAENPGRLLRTRVEDA